MNKRVELIKGLQKRRLVVVDIENFVGSGILSNEVVAEYSKKLTKRFAINEEDMIVVGVSYQENVFPVHNGFKGARIVYKHGKDGADLALKHALDTERIARRFTDVLLVSGDGIFAESARRLEESGLEVVVASRKLNLSSRLASSATLIRYTRVRHFITDRKRAA